MPSEHFPLNTPFKPSLSLVTWFRIDFLLVVFASLILFYLPMVAFNPVPPVVHLVVLGGTLVLVILFFVWVGLYYESMWYELREDEMSWRRGVWFRKTGIVPYNRITNLDIRQGRSCGLSASRPFPSRLPVILARLFRRSGLRPSKRPRSFGS